MTENDDASETSDAPVGRRPGWRTVVADLDARVRRTHQRLTAQVDSVDGRTSELSGIVAEALPRLDDLADALAEVRGRLDASDETSQASIFRPVHWPSLTADEALAAWGDLAAWIGDVLGPWYGLTRGQLPDCWPLHRRAVIELSWLRTSYLVAYSSRASASMAAEWHSRWLRDALAAIAKAIPASKCRPGAHLGVAKPSGEYTPLSPAFGSACARAFVDPKDEVSLPSHWRLAFDTAVHADLEERHQHAREDAAR